MKHIQVIEPESNSALGIFAATEDEFALLFASGQSAVVMDDIHAQNDDEALTAFEAMLQRPVRKRDADRIHGVVFTRRRHPDSSPNNAMTGNRGLDGPLPTAPTDRGRYQSGCP